MTPAADVDTVIVGAGSAGGVLAARLSQQPDRSVLLLEAGPDFGPEGGQQPHEVSDAADVGPTRYDWGHVAGLGELQRRSPVFAGRLVGGSSATNNVMALRGQPDDYDAWATAGNAGWSYDQMLEAFVRVENDGDFGDQNGHGASGPVSIRRYTRCELPSHQRTFLDSCAAAGNPVIADHNARAAVGAGPLPLNAVAGVRQSTALTYLAAARERSNLTVWPHATADRVLLADGRATGVQLADGQHVAARQVLLAAGAYGSPALLLRSGIGPAAHLRQLGIPIWRDVPGVGANLHDHPLLRLHFSAHGQPQSLPCQTLLTTRSDPSLTRPDLQIFPSAIAAGETGPEMSLLVALLQPRSRGRVLLTSPNPTVAPDIDVGLLTHPEDLPRLRAGLRRARQLAGTSPFAEQLVSEMWPGHELSTDQALDQAIRAQLNVYQHPVGTCRMGPATDPTAVVDPLGWVHGVDGLAVIDASIMPTIPTANTNLPTLALADHCAHHLETTPPH
ncbi:GMC family oxidoreductase [Sciscionella marina]|uniref:GMC family oxidoreductase n=1 Tax=Sciscionella marina TaxID=508770 RepID=UPI0004775622|nr:GMC family oxidoreductase N-terminal domain-containing protein [Sciscionella marina]